MESDLQWRDQEAINSSYNSLAIEWKNVCNFLCLTTSSISTPSYYNNVWPDWITSCSLSLSLSLSLSVFLYRYGELQGLNKQETAERYGKEQVHEWRLSFDIPPPNGESLEMCSQRAVAYFREHVSTSSFFLLTFEIHVEFFKSV